MAGTTTTTFEVGEAGSVTFEADGESVRIVGVDCRSGWRRGLMMPKQRRFSRNFNHWTSVSLHHEVKTDERSSRIQLTTQGNGLAWLVDSTDMWTTSKDSERVTAPGCVLTSRVDGACLVDMAFAASPLWQVTEHNQEPDDVLVVAERADSHERCTVGINLQHDGRLRIYRDHLRPIPPLRS